MPPLTFAPHLDSASSVSFLSCNTLWSHLPLTTPPLPPLKGGSGGNKLPPHTPLQWPGSASQVERVLRKAVGLPRTRARVAWPTSNFRIRSEIALMESGIRLLRSQCMRRHLRRAQAIAGGVGGSSCPPQSPLEGGTRGGWKKDRRRRGKLRLPLAFPVLLAVPSLGHLTPMARHIIRRERALRSPVPVPPHPAPEDHAEQEED